MVDSSPLSVANDTVDLLPVADYVILVAGRCCEVTPCSHDASALFLRESTLGCN